MRVTFSIRKIPHRIDDGLFVTNSDALGAGFGLLPPTFVVIERVAFQLAYF